MTKKHEPGMAYDMKKLNKVFAFLSVIFLLTVIWVFLDDYMRPWKMVQIEAMKIKRGKIDAKIKKAAAAIDSEKLSQLNAKLEEGKKIVASRKVELDKISKALGLISRDLKDETIINGQLNAQISALTFNYGVAHANHDKSAHSLFDQMQVKKGLFAKSKNNLKTLDSKKKVLVADEKKLREEFLSAERGIKEILNTKSLLTQAKATTDIDPIFVIRNAPLGDFLDPTVKIQQLVAKNITDDRYFQHVPKVDRCTTCHTFIDKPGYEEQPNPHKTHPNLDIMVDKDSPHPMKSFGCTTCHGGEGHRVTDFNSIAHTPETPEQRAEWIKKYNWHEPHKVPHVMFKKSMTEASCVKCHQGVEWIPQAHVLNEGRRNIEKFGCYGCHKIKGWEHKRKPGPSLKKIASKVDKKFFKSWVWDPKSFNKHAKMPRFFEQDNNSSPEFIKKNVAEVNAIADYIWSISSDYKPFAKYSGGNKKRGKELVKDIGCMGCHGADGFAKESKKIDAYAGPFLTGIGSKVDADWLVSWLKKPSHYQEDTIMPSFRLTNKEANDITAYLMSLKNKTFEKLDFESLDESARDEILISYFSAFDTKEVAEKRLSKMSSHERTLELGKRSIGKYGCYSCHDIEGFDGRAPIGPELTKVGSKPLTQFGFGHEHDVEHSRDGWIQAHLINPRRWDNGVDKPFKDLLRMPSFGMSEKDAKSITIALIGQVGDYVPLGGVKRLNHLETVTEKGMKVVNKFNCTGCHQVDGTKGDILGMFEDDLNEGPPRLNGQGHRVQADWFYHFLSNVYPIRPWLKVRMPSFNLSNKEKNAIVAGFQAKSDLHTFEDLGSQVVWEPGERSAAVKLFKSLDCTSCHSGGFTSDEASAPNLHYAKRRLRPSWIKKWLEDPQAILEGTVMPSFWEDGESADPDILGGDPKKQIDALTKYIIEIGHDKYSPNAK
ncbi:MAG: c-type cytochrome [Bacteriovoracaceae bacterium]|nr:c-type cytochrome [Bacteriovoracaceae bacterium]